jgi:hypothetical protein
MAELYSNDAIREKAEQLVGQNVHYCVSTLISELREHREVPGGYGSSTSAAELMGVDEEIGDISSQPDYEAAVDYHIDTTMDWDDLVDYVHEQGEVEDLDRDNEPDDKEVVKALRVRARELADDQGLEDFCDDFRLDPEHHEAYEFWIVDRWFAARLKEYGEMVDTDLLGMVIWGRCTTGQAISMDHTVLCIAKDLLGA